MLGDPNTQRGPLHEAEDTHLKAHAHWRAKVYAVLEQWRVEEAQQHHAIRRQPVRAQLSPTRELRVSQNLLAHSHAIRDDPAAPELPHNPKRCFSGTTRRERRIGLRLHQRHVGLALWVILPAEGARQRVAQRTVGESC